MLAETKGYVNMYQGMYGLGNLQVPTAEEVANQPYMQCRAAIYDPRMTYNSDPCGSLLPQSGSFSVTDLFSGDGVKWIVAGIGGMWLLGYMLKRK